MALKSITLPTSLLAEMRRFYHSDFFGKVVQTLGTRLILIAIGLITTVLVTRKLGPEGRGLYAAAIAVGAIGIQFGNLGLHASNTYYVAKDRNALSNLIGNSLLTSFGFGGLGIGAAWFVFNLYPQWAPLEGSLLGLALLGVPFSLTYLLLQNLLLGIHDVRAYNLIEIFTKVLAASFIVFLIWFTQVTPTALLLSTLGATGVGLLWLGRRLLFYHKASITISRNQFQSALRYGFRAYLAAFFSYLVLRIDLLIVKQLLGAEQAGYYSVAANMTDLIYMLPVVVGTLLFPKLTAMPDPVQKWRYTRNSAIMIGTLMSIVVTLAALFAQWGIGLLFGQEFLPSAPAFIWLMPAIVLMAINTVFMNYFASEGMPWITVYSPGIAALVNILLNFYLLPKWGIIGASFSSIAAYTLMLLFSFTYIQRKA